MLTTQVPGRDTDKLTKQKFQKSIKSEFFVGNSFNSFTFLVNHKNKSSRSTKNFSQENFALCLIQETYLHVGGELSTETTWLSVKGFFSNCDQICSFLRICSHLLRNSLMENFIFLCRVYVNICRCVGLVLRNV